VAVCLSVQHTGGLPGWLPGMLWNSLNSSFMIAGRSQLYAACISFSSSSRLTTRVTPCSFMKPTHCCTGRNRGPHQE
jgi:hypothetical protein